MHLDKKYYIIGGVILLLLILVGALFFAGSGKKKAPTGQIELVWWKPFENSTNIEDFIADYQKTHKNITITFVKKDINDYENELVNAIASGQGPDIFSIHNDWLPKHFDKLAAAPDNVTNLRAYQDTFLDVASSDFVSGGKIYAVPLAVDLLGLYYNKAILGSVGISQPPTTWKELLTDVEKITKIDKPGTFIRSGVALGTADNINRAVDILSLIMLQNGTNFYSENFTQATFDQTLTDPNTNKAFSPAALALEFYTQFANSGRTSYTWNTKSDYSVDAFTQGKVGMMLNYAYLESAVRDKSPNLDWAVAAVPQLSDEGTRINFANYWGEGVSKSSKNAEVAWDFLNFISSKEELTKYYQKHKQISSRKDILPTQYADTDIGVFAENALTAKSIYKHDANLFEAAFIRMINDVVLRGFDFQNAIKNAQSQINLDLQKK